LWDAPVEDIEEFFMNRVLRLTGKEADTALALYEFNWHLPQLHFSKDKRQVQWVIDIARYHNSMLEKAASPAAGLASASVIVEALHCLQRLFGYRLNYLEVPRLPNLLRLLTDTVRSEHTRVAVAAIMTVLQIIEQPPELKKFEQQNKLVIVQDELVTALLSILAANAKQRTNSLLVYHVLKVFVSIMQTHAATTDKDWYARLLPKLSRPVTVSSLFHLCRSACPAVALNASVMLKVLLQTNTDEMYVDFATQHSHTAARPNTELSLSRALSRFVCVASHKSKKLLDCNWLCCIKFHKHATRRLHVNEWCRFDWSVYCVKAMLRMY